MYHGESASSEVLCPEMAQLSRNDKQSLTDLEILIFCLILGKIMVYPRRKNEIE